MDRITSALLGAGAALLLFRVEPLVLAATLALGVAFFGVYRATGNKAALGSIALLVMSWAAHRAAMFLLEQELEAPGRLVGWVADAAFVAAFVVAVLAAHERVGRALASLVAVTGVLSLAAGAVATLGAIASPSGPDADAALQLVRWIASGQGQLVSILGAVALATIAVGPKLDAPRAPALLVLGAVGATLLAAALGGVPVDEGARHSALGALAWCVTMALGWVLVAVGMAGLARSGVGAAWAGLGLAVLELLVCTPTVVLGADVIDDALGFALLPAFLGLLGVAVALLAAKTLALREARAVAAGLVLVGVLGSCAATGLVAAGIDAIGLHVRDPLWPLTSAREATVLGLALTAAVLALLATPPREPA